METVAIRHLLCPSNCAATPTDHDRDGVSTMVRLVLVLVLGAGAYALPASARACSFSFSPEGVQPIQHRFELPDPLPANALFFSHEGPPELGSTIMPMFEEDLVWSGRANRGFDFGLGLAAFRIADPERFVGTPVELRPCGIEGPRVCVVALGPLDVQLRRGRSSTGCT
jgi:hypothetical protein